MGNWSKLEVIMAWNDWSIISVKNILNPVYLQQPIPWERGKLDYVGPGLVEHTPEESQVNGSLARYNFPYFKHLHYDLKNKLEVILGEPLFPTYYYDRFYFKGNELSKHKDRPACEVSISVHCSTNLDYDWPIWFTDYEGNDIPLITKPGDGVIYKGCDLVHWRDPMKGNHKSYYHQIFFHFVRRNGPHVEHAYDNSATKQY